MKENRECYQEREYRKFYNQKCSKSSLHEKFKFLFIGQGQVDTWQPLISLLEPSKFKEIWKFNILHEIWTFRIRYSHFT